MKEILIINLTRMGDLLQTTPVMAGFKETYPGVKITLLANSQFAEICRGIPFIDELIVFEMKDFKLKFHNSERSIVESFRRIEGLINELNKKEYDLAINFTHSPGSAILTSMVRAGEIRGNTVDAEGHKLLKHPWMRYFFNVVPNREYNPFHLVDMNLKSAGVMSKTRRLFYEIPEGDRKNANEMLQGEGVASNDMLIGLHLGASKGDKRWSAASFAALADMIVREFDAKIILFGSPDEAGLAREFEKTVKFKPLNFAGRTNLGELSSLLKSCSLLISNDSGPLHVATAAGTRVIDVSVANVHYLETGPYGEGHYVIQADLPCSPCDFHVECNNMVCKDIIKPEAVFEVVKEALKDNPSVSPPLVKEGIKEGDPRFKDVQVYKTGFKEDGLIRFDPLVKRPLKKENIYRLLYREVWNMTPEKTNGKADMTYRDLCAELSSFYLLSDIEDVILSLGKEVAALEELVSASGEGFELISLITDEASREKIDVGKVKEIWKRVEAVDAGIELIGYANPCFRPLVLIFTYSKEASEGSELRSLAEDSCRIYRDLNSTSSYLLKMMKKLIAFFEAVSEKRSFVDTLTAP
ncbi:MAG: glycosyltransferase family 9 protein [Nitrospirae bacterium]|nr:glycosyltransferase family 9 protein [Nitrospirota bacterium]